MLPSITPVGNSRSATRHQSRSLTSWSATARMISEVAWDPELPPELMISGIKRVRTTAFSSSDSKCCIALAVSISPRKSAHSQPARFRIISSVDVTGLVIYFSIALVFLSGTLL
jgi:hypothetical protein